MILLPNLPNMSLVFSDSSSHMKKWAISLKMGLAQAMAPHSSTLAWKISWMEEPGGLQSMGSLRVRYDWATSLSLFTFMHWRRKWQPTPVFLPGESQVWGGPSGLLSMGSHRVRHNWRDLAAAAAAQAEPEVTSTLCEPVAHTSCHHCCTLTLPQLMPEALWGLPYNRLTKEEKPELGSETEQLSMWVAAKNGQQL